MMHSRSLWCPSLLQFFPPMKRGACGTPRLSEPHTAGASADQPLRGPLGYHRRQVVGQDLGRHIDELRMLGEASNTPAFFSVELYGRLDAPALVYRSADTA